MPVLLEADGCSLRPAFRRRYAVTPQLRDAITPTLFARRRPDAVDAADEVFAADY